MEPTLHCPRPQPGCEGHQRDLIYAVPYKGASPRRGDIVVVETPQRAGTVCGSRGLFVKRVIGLPGDAWSERKGFVYINGRRLVEPYVAPDHRDDLTLTLAGIPPRRKRARIPPRMFIVLGDNRSSSCDSRFWGFLPLANVRGKVVEIKRGSQRIHLR